MKPANKIRINLNAMRTNRQTRNKSEEVGNLYAIIWKTQSAIIRI